MWASGAERDALADRPDEPEQLAGDSGGGHHRALPARGEPAIGLVQAELGLPGQRDDVLRHGWAPLLHPLPHLWGGAIIPSRLA
jgi:hypothetical protein